MRRFVVFDHIWMILSDVRHTDAKAVTLGEADIAAEDGFGGPIFLWGVTGWWCLESRIEYQNNVRITFLTEI